MSNLCVSLPFIGAGFRPSCQPLLSMYFLDFCARGEPYVKPYAKPDVILDVIRYVLVSSADVKFLR